MIKSAKRYCTGRFRFIVSLVLCLTVWLLTAAAGEAAPAAGSKQQLMTVRGEQHGDYSAIVFEFDGKITFDQPVVKDREVLILFKDTETAVAPARKHQTFDSWFSVEKKDDDMEARIGIPEDYPSISHFWMTEPERLVIRFSRDNGATGVQAAAANAKEKSGAADTPPRRSYNYRDIDIRQALSALAQDQDINLIISPGVTGKVTAHLNKVTIEEALRDISMAGGFLYKKQDDCYYVYKPKEVKDPQSERLQIRVFRLRFAAVDKVQEILAAIPGMRIIRVHEPSKTIIVEDIPENIAKIDTVLKSWDIAPQQVLIEARIMQVTLTDDMSLGVDWQKIFGDLTIGTTGFLTGPTGLTANLATAVGSRDQFTAALNALQVKTKVNTLSTPKILALHGKMARVQVGGRQGYRTSSVSGEVVTEKIDFLDTGTILEITPYIYDAGNVLLEVKPQINSVTFDATGTPNLKTTTVSTSMLARNGQTIFIGGLIEDTKTDMLNAIPCLGSIPGLGLLFGQMRDGINKSELIVLITPQILDLEATSAAALEKTMRLENLLKKEPLPIQKRLLEGK